MSDQQLRGRAAFVTGAADGIGFAIADALIRAGAHVTLADIDAAMLARATDALRTGPGRVFSVLCDVGRTDQVDAAVAAAVAHAGRLDIVVNNAAIALAGDPAVMSDEDWGRVLNTNLTSVFRVVRAALPALRRAGGGAIINLSSTQAHRSWSNWTAYAAAKGGVIAMSRQLAGQLGAEHIRVNTISPGAINTPMNARRVAQEGEELLHKWAGMHALPRLGEPSEVAAVALLLASDAGAFVTGADFVVDGGLCVLPRYQE